LRYQNREAFFALSNVPWSVEVPLSSEQISNTDWKALAEDIVQFMTQRRMEERTTTNGTILSVQMYMTLNFTGMLGKIS